MARQIPLAEFPAFIEDVAKETEKQLAAGVLNSAQVLAGHIAETIITEQKAPHPANIRTGALSRSFLEGVKFLGMSRGKVAAKTSSRLPYARIQDLGGIITPKTRQNLSVPLNSSAAKRWPRDWGRELFFVKSKRGNKLLVTRSGRGKRARIDPQYVLKHQVYIEGKEYLARALLKARDALDQIIGRALIEGVK